MVDAAHEGNLDVLFTSGGNFLEVLPDPGFVEEALGRVPLRVHMDIVLSTQMLVEPADTVVILPATTRYEVPGGVTETSTERRVIFSPEISGPRIGEARSEWEVFMELARRVRPELHDRLQFAGTDEIRGEIAGCVPMYEKIATLKREGDEFQYGGSQLCWGWDFPTPDGKAHFAVVRPRDVAIPAGMFLLSTRRGKQFNSMVQGAKDPLNNAQRDAVMISREDADRLGLSPGEAVALRNDQGTFTGRVFITHVKPGNLQVHWPEGEALLDRRRRSPGAGIPDYNALVRVERAAGLMEA
jgi:anaerobic selenocysteine-containing dehydrogenase